MQFIIKDKGVITRLQVSNQYEANRFLGMFPDD